MQRFVAIRWALLVLVLLSVLSVAVTEETIEMAEETAPETATEEVVAEETVPAEPEPEEEPEPEPVVEDPEPEPEPEPEPVKEDPVVEEEPAKEAVKSEGSGSGIVGEAISKVTGCIDTCLGKTKAFVKRCKNMSKKDMTKTAVAAVGLWGVSVAVGWLVESAKSETAPPKGRKK